MRKLGKLGDSRAGDPMIDALYRASDYGPRTKRDLVDAAAEALGNLGVVRGYTPPARPDPRD